MLARLLLLVVLAFSLSGCGLLFQLYAGYDREEMTTEEVTQTVLINSLPRGAQVEQLEGTRRISLGRTPLEKKVTFHQEVTVQKPAGMAPFWIGTLIDAAMVAGSGVLLETQIADRIENEDARQLVWAVWSNLIIGLIGEAVVGGIVGGRPAVVIKRRDIPAELELSLSRPGGAEIQAHLELPAAGERVTIPLDPLAARAMNRPGGALTLIVAKTSSISIIRTSTRAR